MANDYKYFWKHTSSSRILNDGFNSKSGFPENLDYWMGGADRSFYVSPRRGTSGYSCRLTDIGMIQAENIDQELTELVPVDADPTFTVYAINELLVTKDVKMVVYYTSASGGGSDSKSFSIPTDSSWHQIQFSKGDMSSHKVIEKIRFEPVDSNVVSLYVDDAVFEGKEYIEDANVSGSIPDSTLHNDVWIDENCKYNYKATIQNLIANGSYRVVVSIQLEGESSWTQLGVHTIDVTDDSTSICTGNVATSITASNEPELLMKVEVKNHVTGYDFFSKNDMDRVATNSAEVWESETYAYTNGQDDMRIRVKWRSLHDCSRTFYIKIMTQKNGAGNWSTHWSSLRNPSDDSWHVYVTQSPFSFDECANPSDYIKIKAYIFDKDKEYIIDSYEPVIKYYYTYQGGSVLDSSCWIGYDDSNVTGHMYFENTSGYFRRIIKYRTDEEKNCSDSGWNEVYNTKDHQSCNSNNYNYGSYTRPTGAHTVWFCFELRDNSENLIDSCKKSKDIPAKAPPCPPFCP